VHIPPSPGGRACGRGTAGGKLTVCALVLVWGWVGTPLLAQSVNRVVATDTSVDTFQVDFERTQPSQLQDGPNLYRIQRAILPADGLLRTTLGINRYGTYYDVGNNRLKVDLTDFLCGLEYGIFPALHIAGEIRYRSWSNAFPPYPASGSGFGDSRLFLFAALPQPASFFAMSFWGGASLPTGSTSAGLTEGIVSPEAGLAATWRIWPESQYPELRLHLNLGYRWNRNESTGYGFTQGDGFEPWPPRYPSVAPDSRSTDNDFVLWGGAVEFRAGTVALYVEYTEAALLWSGFVARREYQQFVTGGLRWGKVEGFALDVAYDVSLALEDYATPFTTAYPDLLVSVALSYQFPIGGRDRDGDGIPDRRDQCPQLAEDLDRFQDEDGCPELDNDYDGVPDTRDAAPLQAEDIDGFADEDGLPDPDNDGDGILDKNDECPDTPEDLDGHRDKDGCPEEFYDRDNDGIEDDDDRCPEVPEDRDGFEDNDGCPESDNDLDGIEDTNDQCPNQPEDFNGIDDEDGCPDSQNGETTNQTGSG